MVVNVGVAKKERRGMGNSATGRGGRWHLLRATGRGTGKVGVSE